MNETIYERGFKPMTQSSSTTIYEKAYWGNEPIPAPVLNPMIAEDLMKIKEILSSHEDIDTRF